MKTIIFDFDGVILDSFNTGLKILQELHRKHKLPELTEKKFTDLFEGNIWENYEELGVKGEKKELFLSEIKEQLIHRQDEMTFFVGIKTCIQALSKNNLIIITSNHSDLVKHLLELENMNSSFNKIIGAEIPGNKKDKIHGYLQENKLEGENVYFITDTAGDIREVEGLPVKTIAVSWGYHSFERLKKSSADIILHTPSELQRYLL